MAASSFVALGAGVVILVTVLALLRDREDRLAGGPASPRLPAIAGLLGLGVVANVYQHNTLLLVATLAAILGLFWLNALKAGSEHQARSPLNSGWLLGSVALAGLAILATTTLGSVSRIASDLGAAASIAALVLLLAAYALNVTLLGLATRRLRGEGEGTPWGPGEVDRPRDLPASAKGHGCGRPLDRSRAERIDRGLDPDCRQPIECRASRHPADTAGGGFTCHPPRAHPSPDPAQPHWLGRTRPHLQPASDHCRTPGPRGGGQPGPLHRPDHLHLGVFRERTLLPGPPHPAPGGAPHHAGGDRRGAHQAEAGKKTLRTRTGTPSTAAGC